MQENLTDDLRRAVAGGHVRLEVEPRSYSYRLVVARFRLKRSGLVGRDARSRCRL